MKITKSHFFEYAQADTILPVELDYTLIRNLDMFSSIITGSCYILDIRSRQFCYVQPNDLFLCGYSAEEALEWGYDFYLKTVYSKDLRLWATIHKAILQYMKENIDKWDEIDHFSCTFRLKRKYSFLKNPLPQMVYHLMKPIREDNELRYLICSIGSSTAKEAGNLRLYNKDGMSYKKYNFVSKKWKEKTTELITEREKAILMLAQQGQGAKEIADNLCKSPHTIHNQMTELFFKLEVHSIMGALDLASNRRMIYVRKHDLKEQEHPPAEAPKKRTRTPITDEMMNRIQTYLNEGLSTRKTADKIGISESAIRYWKGKKKLT